VQKAYDENIHIPPKEYRQFLQVCWDKYKQHSNSKTTFQLKDHLWTLFLYEQGLYTPPALKAAQGENKCSCEVTDGCNCARNHITILPNGDIYACRRMESKVGNIHLAHLYNVWTGENMNAYRQYDKFEKCAKCNLLGVCRGCPSVSYGYTNNFYAADPQCWREL
jgi:radical SAM protein with 4Fe4S-binding SPASM domain